MSAHALALPPPGLVVVWPTGLLVALTRAASAEPESDATRWPGSDDNGDTADPGEHAVSHPVGCP